MPGPSVVSPNVLLVEGSNDQQFVYQLTNQVGIARGAYEIPAWRDGGGFQTMLDSLPGFLAGSNLQRLGIVVDADDVPSDHWRAVVSRLDQHGYHLPPEPAAGGLVHQEPGKQIVVGVWLMPDNGSRGMLEDLASQLLPPGDLLWPRAVETVERISQLEQRFKPTYKMKAQLHTWLAWQEEPGTPLGLAMKRGYLKEDAPLAAEFVSWLKRLFEL